MSTYRERFLLLGATLTVVVQAVQFLILQVHSSLYTLVYPTPHQRLKTVAFRSHNKFFRFKIRGSFLRRCADSINHFTLIGIAAFTFYPTTIALSSDKGSFETLLIIFTTSVVLFLIDTSISPRCDGTRTSWMALFAHACNAIVAVFMLNIMGLSMLDPPDEATPELLNSRDSLVLVVDSYYAKFFSILFLTTLPKFVYRKRWKQIFGMSIHVILNACVWYIWKTSTTSNSLFYFHYLALELWKGRNLLFLLHTQVTIQQHSMTFRKLPFTDIQTLDQSRNSNFQDDTELQAGNILRPVALNVDPKIEVNQKLSGSVVLPVENTGSDRSMGTVALAPDSILQRICNARDVLKEIHCQKNANPCCTHIPFIVSRFSEREVLYHERRLDILESFIIGLQETSDTDSSREMAYKKLSKSLDEYNEALLQNSLNGNFFLRLFAHLILRDKSRKLSKAIQGLQHTVTFQKVYYAQSGVFTLTIIEFNGCNKPVQEFYRSHRSVYETRIFSRMFFKFHPDKNL